MGKTTCCLLLLLFSFSVFSQKIYYVDAAASLGGDGLSAGSAFKTISNAQMAVRSWNASNNVDFIINIKPGTYLLDTPLQFIGADSADEGKTITYRKTLRTTGEVIISGGKDLSTITNPWTFDTARNLWYKNVGSLYSRQVYINGVKAIRAKSNTTYGLIETTTGYLSTCNTDNFHDWVLTEKQIKDLEIVSNYEWKSNRIPITAKCGPMLTINPIIREYNHKGQFYFCGAPVTRLENAWQLIDEIGEWYIDRDTAGSHKLYIKTTSSSTPPSNVIVPQVEYLLQATDLNRVSFEGLTFQYATWNLPSQAVTGQNTNHGITINQADHHFDFSNIGAGNAITIPAGVTLTKSNHIIFTKCIFEHMGSTGLQFMQESGYNTIHDNIFRDIAASGISLPHYSHNDALSTNNTITYNLIEKVAQDYNGSIGIFIATARNSTIEHNEIREFPYSGISVGWGWGAHNDNIGKNIISYNRINCSYQTMDDTAAIYTLDKQGACDTSSRSVIERNYILNFHRRYGALYFDSGSQYFEVHHNVIEKLSPNPNPNPPIDPATNKWAMFQVNLGGNMPAKNIHLYNNYIQSGAYPLVSSINPSSCVASDENIFAENNEGNNLTSTEAMEIKNCAGRNTSPCTGINND